MIRRWVAPLLLLPLLTAVPAGAAEATSSLSARTPTTSWTGTTDNGAGCADALVRCHVQVLTVATPPGRLVMVSLNSRLALEVLAPDGRVVARDNVQGLITRSASEPHEGDSDVTFEQLPGSGTVRYRVRVSESPTRQFSLGASAFKAAARLGGQALDRDPECGVVGTPTLALDAAAVLPLHVRVVTSADLVAKVRRSAPVAVDAYRAIGVAMTLSYDVTPLPKEADAEELHAFARRRYGGKRPAGTDAVYVANESFGGGQADCIGGTLHPELGFSAGQVSYTTPERVVTSGPGTVSAGSILAHEVGHSLGGHHEQGNCAEAAPGQPGAGTSTESRGPCTLMSPLALSLGRTFSTLEKGAIRTTLQRR